VNTPWVWIDAAVLRAAHDEQLAEHGGGAGTRDEGLLESALVRARNLAAYGDPDVAELAAAYGFGVARNHPFVDGNKRTALASCLVFMERNGLLASDAPGFANIDAWEALVLDVAASRLDRDATTARLRALVRPPRRRRPRTVPRDR
jgi:death-on-curing protein